MFKESGLMAMTGGFIDLTSRIPTIEADVLDRMAKPWWLWLFAIFEILMMQELRARTNITTPTGERSR